VGLEVRQAAPERSHDRTGREDLRQRHCANVRRDDGGRVGNGFVGSAGARQPVVPPTGAASPVIVNGCSPKLLDAPPKSIAGIPIASNRTGVQIEFTNESKKTADLLIKFAVDSNGERFIIRDGGTFSHGVSHTAPVIVGSGRVRFNTHALHPWKVRYGCPNVTQRRSSKSRRPAQGSQRSWLRCSRLTAETLQRDRRSAEGSFEDRGDDLLPGAKVQGKIEKRRRG